MSEQLLPVIKGLVRQNATGDVPASIGDKDIYDAHYFAALFGFVVMGMGILVAALGKKQAWWFKLHAGLQSIATMVFLISIICGFLSTTDDHEPLSTPHGLLGSVAGVLALAQPLLGYIADILYNPKRKGPPVFPDLMHKYNGYFLLLLITVSLVTGLNTENAVAGGAQLGLMAFSVAGTIAVFGMVIVSSAVRTKQMRQFGGATYREAGGTVREHGNSRARTRTGSGAPHKDSTTRGPGKNKTITINYFGDVRPFTLYSDSTPEDLADQFRETFEDLEGEVVGIYKRGEVMIPLGMIPRMVKKIKEADQYFLALKPLAYNSEYGASSMMGRLSSIMRSKKNVKSPEQVEKEARKQRKEARKRGDSAAANHVSQDGMDFVPGAKGRRGDYRSSGVYSSGMRKSGKQKSIKVYDQGMGIRIRDLYLSEPDH